MSPVYHLKRLLARHGHVYVFCQLCPLGSHPVLFKHLRTHVSTTHGIRCHRECHFCFGYKKWPKGGVKYNYQVNEHRLQCATNLLNYYNPEVAEFQPNVSEEHQEQDADIEDTECLKMIELGQNRLNQLQNSFSDMKKQFDSSRKRKVEMREQLKTSQDQAAQLREQVNEIQEQLSTSRQRETQLRQQLMEFCNQLEASQQRETALQQTLNMEREKMQQMNQLFHKSVNEDHTSAEGFAYNLERDLNQTVKEDLKKKRIDTVIEKVTKRKMEETQRHIELQNLSNRQAGVEKCHHQTTFEESESSKRKRLKQEQRKILERSMWR